MRSRHKGGSSVTSGFSTAGIIVAVFLICLALFAAYKMMNKKKEKFTDAAETSENLNTCDKTKAGFTIMFFSMDTCPHCKDFEPTWEQFEAYAQSNDMLSRSLCVTRVSADDRNTCKKYKIQGFPTIFIVNNTTKAKTEFKGSRTLDSLKKFVLENVS
jgi:thioredoxin-related protein